MPPERREYRWRNGEAAGFEKECGNACDEHHSHVDAVLFDREGTDDARTNDHRHQHRA